MEASFDPIEKLSVQLKHIQVLKTLVALYEVALFWFFLALHSIGFPVVGLCILCVLAGMALVTFHLNIMALEESLDLPSSDYVLWPFTRSSFSSPPPPFRPPPLQHALVQLPQDFR